MQRLQVMRWGVVALIVGFLPLVGAAEAQARWGQRGWGYGWNAGGCTASCVSCSTCGSTSTMTPGGQSYTARYGGYDEGAGNPPVLAWIPMSPFGPNKTGRKCIDSVRCFSALLRIHVLFIA